MINGGLMYYIGNVKNIDDCRVINYNIIMLHTRGLHTVGSAYHNIW